jgi:hypothetical protein
MIYSTKNKTGKDQFSSPVQGGLVLVMLNCGFLGNEEFKCRIVMPNCEIHKNKIENKFFNYYKISNRSNQV